MLLGKIAAVLWKLRKDDGGKNTDIACRCELAWIKQAVGIYEMSGAQSQLLGRRIHFLDKTVDRAIGPFGKHIGHVIGRIDQQRLKRQVYRNGAARAHADLAGLLRSGQGRHQDFLVKAQGAGFQFLENYIGGHQLGERSWIPGFARPVVRNDFACRGIKQNGRPRMGHR